MKKQKKQKGKAGEELALEFLKNKGYRLLEKNFSTRLGEIDLVVQKGDALVFVEVKAFTTNEASAVEKVDYRKREKITKVAEIFMLKNSKLLSKIREIRFDVLTVNLSTGEVRHYEGAFFKE